MNIRMLKHRLIYTAHKKEEFLGWKQEGMRTKLKISTCMKLRTRGARYKIETSRVDLRRRLGPRMGCHGDKTCAKLCT